MRKLIKRNVSSPNNQVQSTSQKPSCFPLPEIDYNSEWVAFKTTSLSEQLKTLQTQHSEFLLDNISIVSRIGLLAGREMRRGYHINYKQPLFVEEEIKQASPDAKALLRELLNKNDIKQLGEAVLSGRLPSNESWFGKHFRVFLVERVLESNLENQEEAIEHLLDAGVNVWFTDIIAAIHSDVSDEIVKRLFQSSTLGPGKILQKGTLFLSLTNIAIEQQRNVVIY